jgi:hypothetical protein
VRASPDLELTPRRVAEAWLEDLVDGYGREPAEILAGAIPSDGQRGSLDRCARGPEPRARDHGRRDAGSG